MSCALDLSRSDSDSDCEDFQTGVNGSQYSDLREGMSGSPLYPRPVAYPTELNRGDHILFQVPRSITPFRPLYQSALVIAASEKDSIQVITYSKEGIREETRRFSSFWNLHKVEYNSSKYSAKKAVLRAKWRLKAGENHYHTLYNNSHFFVTWSKTGNEYALNNVIDGLIFDEDKHYPLNPILSLFVVKSMADVNPGDHLMVGTSHYLVETTKTEPDTTATLTVYTTKNGGSVEKEEKKFDQFKGILRLDYDQQSNLYHPGRAIESAAKEFQQKTEKWECSDHFVTMMKCGRKHVVTEKCLFVGDVEPTSCTSVTPQVAVDVGDHLVVREIFGEYHSVLVYGCINERTLVTMPDAHTKGNLGRLNLLDYNEIYRINYPQSLPVDEILRRCTSPEGEQILMEVNGDKSRFVSWVKIGRQVSINVRKLIQKQEVAQIRPFQYEKLASLDEIQVGDHLFIPNPAYRWHFLVTEKVEPATKKSSLFKVAYCLRGSIRESEEKIDPTKDDVFKVVYSEEYPLSLAIKRARSLIGKVTLAPTARMWFIRWVKTGSDEGLEIDFLKRKSLPVAKSRILCFSQLNPGDYLVHDKGRFSLRHHYLVISVESSQVCTVIGTWKGQVLQSQLSLDNSIYYRIIYEEGVCISVTETICRAQEAVRSHFYLKYSRRKLVNYLKTTDSVEIDVGSLPDDRVLLRRERVETGLDLRPGDHVEFSVKVLQKLSYRNMIVTDTIDDRKVRIVCVNPRRGKQQLVEMDFEVTNETEIYRVKYLERIDAEEGIKILRRKVKQMELGCTGSTDAYTGEALLTLATVGQAINIQVNPEIHKILQCRKEDVRKPLSVNNLRSVSIEAGVKASVNTTFKLGSRVVLQGTRLGTIVGFGPGINLLAEAPFFTRRVYKLSRQRKFDQITEEDFKRGIIQQSFTSANTVIGATAGAIIGQVAIPIPVVGAAIGGALGTISGNGIGRLEGWAASKLVRDAKSTTLPIIVKLQFSDMPEI